MTSLYGLAKAREMSQNCVARFLIVLSMVAALLDPATGQDRRRALRTPGLVIETGRPIATTYQLAFTDDGKRLLSAGADKVVRGWPFADGRLDADLADVLRWASWREQRGTIYDIALSPDDEQRYVAVAGFGMVTGSIAVLDRQSGQVSRALTAPNSGEAIMSLAFSPSGDKLAYGTSHGSIWLWDLKSDLPNDTRRLGGHEGEQENRVRLVAFIAEQRVLSVARDGTTTQWIVGNRDGEEAESFRFNLSHLRSAVISADRSWLASAGFTVGGDRGSVELRTVDGRHIKTIGFARGRFPHALAVSRDDSQMAISVDATGTSPHQPTRSAVAMYDVAAQSVSALGVRPDYVVDALAFHPGGADLAIAGGNNFELSVWNLANQRQTDQVRGPGRCLWQVSLSADKRLLGFREERNGAPRGFNDWGAGAWRVFDLHTRNWHRNANDFQPVTAIWTLDGWRVEPDARDVHVWRVVGPDNRAHELPLERNLDLQPRCYTFIPATDGKPVRLAVGHQWGVSIFELGPNEPRRTRLYVGHAAEVTSIVVSRDAKILVSASRDHTIASWSLADWEHEPELGASFEVRGGRLLVRAVAAGSPAWEAGLLANDEIVLLAYHGQVMPGGPTQWLTRLRQAVPGHEFFFRVRRAGEAQPLEMLTTVRQRPVWRFFPTSDGEWVLWRWRDYFYDSSTKGDSYIGWQVVGDVSETPEFHEAEKFRERFHQPDRIDDVIALTRFEPERVAIPELLPPKVTIAVHVQDDQLEIDLSAIPRSGGFAMAPREVSLWINDYRIQRWLEPGERFSTTVRVPRDRLRRGTNELIAQSYNNAGARGDSDRIQVRIPGEADRPSLFGLFIGISDYSGAAPGRDGRRLWDNLFFAADDARSLATQWERQGVTDLYDRPFVHQLLEAAATRDAILGRLHQLSGEVRPDDVFILFLAGHGYAKQVRTGVFQPHTFAFACPSFDVGNAAQTGISGRTLYDAVVALPCHKLVLLDCCHSGSSNVLRDLTPDGIGPVMIAACQPHESSYDIPFLGHGAFSNAVVEALGERFTSVDQDRDMRLSVTELVNYVAQRVPQTVALARPVLGDDAMQTPQAFLPRRITWHSLATQNAVNP